MTASLYQSGSAPDSFVLDGMRVTFAAQSAPRNDPLVCAEERYPGSAGAEKKAAALPRPPFEQLKCGLSLNFADLRSDALPLSVAQDPGVGEKQGSVERFTVFARSLFPGAAGHNRNIRPERLDVKSLVFRRLVGVLVLLVFCQHAGLV